MDKKQPRKNTPTALTVARNLLKQEFKEALLYMCWSTKLNRLTAIVENAITNITYVIVMTDKQTDTEKLITPVAKATAIRYANGGEIQLTHLPINLKTVDLKTVKIAIANIDDYKNIILQKALVEPEPVKVEKKTPTHGSLKVNIRLKDNDTIITGYLDPSDANKDGTIECPMLTAWLAGRQCLSYYSEIVNDPDGVSFPIENLKLLGSELGLTAKVAVLDLIKLSKN
jgi:hypothetical protein